MIQKTSFSSGFHFFYDSEWNRGRQRKIKNYFSIHELIVRNLGTIQLQFDGGLGGYDTNPYWRQSARL